MRILTCSMIDINTGNSIIDIKDDVGVFTEGRTEKDGGKCTVTKLGSNHYMAIVTNPRCFLAKMIKEYGCFLMSAEPVTDTLIKWTLVGPDNTVLHKLLKAMRDSGYVFEVVSSSSVSSSTTMTDRQEECFNLAIDLGYYDVPKRICLDDLCKLTGCSKSTLNVTLRSAEKKIFDFYRIFSRGGSII